MNLIWKRRFASITGVNGMLNKSARDISLRACCTQLLLTRWALESSGKNSEPFRGEEAHRALTTSIKKTEIDKFMTRTELNLIQKEYLSWNFIDEVIPTGHRWESFGVLLWALRIVKDIPPYFERFPHESMYKATAIIPAFPNTIDTFVEYFSSGLGIEETHIISQQDFSHAIAVSEAWYWRARAQLVLDLKLSLDKEPEHLKKVPAQLQTVMKSIESSIKMASERALEEGFITNTVDDDFAVKGGIAYKNMDDHVMRDVAAATEARLAALGWLSNTHEWDYVPGDVKFINPLGSLWSAEE